MKLSAVLIVNVYLFAAIGRAAESKQDALAPETAVVISASKENEGALKEVAWIQVGYPGSRILRFVTRPTKGGRVLDVFFIKTAEGKKLTLYFEISSFYHKT